uniref:Protein phosphatase 1 regulatory subunit 3B-A-like n=1 Tax=Saccoglossus kowalevskii TaxID=10224 RepID=A0ABM0MQT3_SACKO|nr:PREDICTED: protein phosphatase 1 regulatory subunit 3B-A-like [Saccoglossus kowalevskii]
MDAEFVDEFEASLIDDIFNSEFRSNNAVYETLGIVPDMDEENEFEQRVEEQWLYLENVECTKEGARVTVRVADNGIDKTVKIRYTRNNWQTFQDVDVQSRENTLDKQSESSGISNSASDKGNNVGKVTRTPATVQFIFELVMSMDFGIGSRLEFAIYCETDGRTI